MHIPKTVSDASSHRPLPRGARRKRNVISLFFRQFRFIYFHFFVLSHIFQGTNALPIWTMTDLLQMNGNDLNNSLAATAPKAATICPAAQLHTKRSSTANAVKSTRSNASSTAVANASSNHKRSSSMDTNGHKRLKCSTDTTVRMTHATHPVTPTTPTPSSINFYPQSYQLQKQPTAPHLLQHLMAPTPRARKFNDTVGRGNGSAANMNGNDAMHQQQQQQRWNNGGGADDDGQSTALYQQLQNGGDANKSVGSQPSNSVLKNLLVSGCDISAGYICAAPQRAKKTAQA